jgi:hypothetical protein
MNTTPKGRTLQEAKRQIAQKSKEFDARLLKAKNDFEIIVVLNDMQELIEAEIFAWTNLVADDTEEREQEDEDVLNNAAKHVADLNDFIITLNNQRKALMPNALKIQRAMLNSHQLTEPKIKED